LSEHGTHEHREIAELIRGIDVRAPAELHERVAAMVASAPRRRTAARLLRPAPALTGLALAAAAVIAALLIASGSSSRTHQPGLLSAAAGLALAPATSAAPAEDRHGHAHLLANVEGVSFPYWERDLGWRSTGARTGVLAGRPVQTVYYSARGGASVGYSILGGYPAPQPRGGTVDWKRGNEYRLLKLDGANAVVWLRQGRLCVLVGRGVAPRTLVGLASWDAARGAAA
jgi:hypothetical protein